MLKIMNVVKFPEYYYDGWDRGMIPLGSLLMIYVQIVGIVELSIMGISTIRALQWYSIL